MVDVALVAAAADDEPYEEIRRRVIEGRYPAGSRLVEQRLAEDLDVSRTPVREALRRLAAEGLVVYERNRGAQVPSLDAAEIADLYDARSRLESYAAELAAERRTHDDLKVLDEAVARFDGEVRTPRKATSELIHTRRLAAANAAVHQTILDAAHHVALRHLVGRTVDVPLVFAALRQFGPDELARSSLFHGLIRDAIVAQEPERASRLMAEHVLQGRDALVAEMGRR